MVKVNLNYVDYTIIFLYARVLLRRFVYKAMVDTCWDIHTALIFNVILINKCHCMRCMSSEE